MNLNNKKEIARELWKRVNKRLEETIEYKRASDNEKLKKLAKRLQLTRRYFDDYSVEFDSDFQKKFKRLYFRGFQASLGSQENLKELHDLKDDFGKEVEKVIKESKQETLPTSPPTFIKDSQFHFGKGDNVGGDKIAQEKNENQSVFKYIVGGFSILGVLFVIGWGIYTHFNPKESKEDPRVEITDSILENSPIFQILNSSNVSVSVDYNDYEQVSPNIPIVMSLKPSSIFPNSDFLNLKFVLPDGSEAFIPRMSHDREYIIAYRDDGCSDFYVPEEYRMTEEIQDKDLCFITTIGCEPGGDQVVLGARALDGSVNRSDGGCIK